MKNIDIHYHLLMEEPHTHLFKVHMSLSRISSKTLDFFMPVWTPGSYLVRDFSKNVQNVRAFSKSTSLNVSKLNKNTWRVVTGNQNKITFEYQVYAFELTVRTSFLDVDHAMINGASVFMCPSGFEHNKSVLTIEPYFEWSKVSTELTPDKGDKHRFKVKNYDQLVDTPIELGNQQIKSFKASNITHDYAVIGKGNADYDKIIADSKNIIEETHRIFGDIPYDHYTFFLYLTNNAYGGLEHKNCSSLIYDRWKFSKREDYIKFIGLVSHEYFHTYNVKRIRPKELGPFDYHKENYTDLLWIAEGMTAYFDNQILRRANVVTTEEYFKLLTDDIKRFENVPGRMVQSVAEASFDAWIKLYQMNENTVNSTVSYYLKGSLIALALDLTIRKKTNNKYSLDDVYKLLWKEYKNTSSGFTEADFIRISESIAETSLDSIWNMVHSKDEIDFNKIFAIAGLQLNREYKDEKDSEKSVIGVRFDEDKLIIKQIYADSPAYKGGLNAHDELIAVDGIRLTLKNKDDRLSNLPTDNEVTFTISRDGLLRKIQVTPQVTPKNQYTLTKVENADTLQQQIYESWVNEKWNQDED